MAGGSARPAWWIGLMLGAACATKYLAALFVAGPVLAAMVLVALLTVGRAKTLWHIGPTVLAAALLVSPWLIRNVAATGNPVFPLATRVFGAAHWDAESQQRWIDGHAPDKRPPVPTPPGWQMPGRPSRLAMVYRNFVANQLFGPLLVLMTAGAIAALVVGRGARDPWDYALATVAGVQLLLWGLLTHELPDRFLAPLTVPMVLLVGGLLQRMSLMRGNPFRAGVSDGRHWGPSAAGVMFVATAGLSLYIAFQLTWATYYPANGLPIRTIATETFRKSCHLSDESRPMLVGEARAFYFPSSTVYATTFDRHPLAAMMASDPTPQEAMDHLRAMGVTHVVVGWEEIVRLAETYGYPEVLSREAVACYEGAWPGDGETGGFARRPTLKLFEQMRPLGVISKVVLAPAPQTQPATQPTSQPATQPTTQPFYLPPTVYVMPWAEAPPAETPEVVGNPADR